jgi:phytoene desaturase
MYPPIRQDLPVEERITENTDAIVKAALCSIRKRFELDIVVKRVITPKDFQERMQIYKGAVYGLSPAIDPRKQFPHKTSIKGLFQAGANNLAGLWCKRFSDVGYICRGR